MGSHERICSGLAYSWRTQRSTAHRGVGYLSFRLLLRSDEDCCAVDFDSKSLSEYNRKIEDSEMLCSLQECSEC